MGGHGAWSDASNVGMVPPAGYKKHWSAHPFPKHLLVKKASEVEVEEERRQMLLKKKRDGDRNLDRLTGVMTVRSGRWLPPAHGWLLRITSPSFNLFPNDLICTETKKHDILSVRKECLFFSVSAACLNSHPSPGTGPSLAWPPGGQGCGAHWTLNHRPVQTQHRRSRDAP